MPSRKSYLILFFILLILTGCAPKQPSRADAKLFELEDEYILYAIEYTNEGKYFLSRDLYLELFQKTDKYEYLLRALRFSLELKDFEFSKRFSEENLDSDVPEYEQIYRIYIVSLLNLQEYDKALSESKKLLEKFNNILNYELIGNVYYIKKDFANAVEYFESAYSVNNNPATLLNLVNILYSYLNEQEKAISYLETHVRLQGCDVSVCTRLLSIYQEQKNIDGVISILKRTYEKFKAEQNFTAMIKTYKMLIDFLEQKDVKLAIEFLEKNHIDDIKLVSLYKISNQMQKALDLLRKVYKLNKNIDYLAQIAILEFEIAPNKRKVIKDVIKKFESVLAVLDNHIYQNYLGYLLIDYNINLKQGVSLVEKALEKAPNNLAYVDSLAWGYYKQKKCKKAYVSMKKVVDAIGLNDDEIKYHWKKIQECHKK